MQDSVYLGDLGGMSRHRQLVVLDLRGTGRSAIPEDTSSYRCDRLVDDVEALRAHLGLDRMDLLGHSAGANLATLYAVRHPHRIGKLALVTPSTFAVGIPVTGETRRETARLRQDEPWFPAAFAALEAITDNRAGDADWAAIAPFRHGRWDAEARSRHVAQRPRRTRKPPGSSPPRAPSPRRPPVSPWPPTGIRSCCSPGSSTSTARLGPWSNSRGCFRTPRSPSSGGQAISRGTTTLTCSWRPSRHS
jgi:pimeloyl-ACP methyl ester carboxylesterase